MSKPSTVTLPISGTVTYKETCCGGQLLVESQSSVYVVEFRRDCCMVEESMSACLLCGVPWCLYICMDMLCFMCVHDIATCWCQKKSYIRRTVCFDCTSTLVAPNIADINNITVDINAANPYFSKKIKIIMKPPQQEMI